MDPRLRGDDGFSGGGWRLAAAAAWLHWSPLSQRSAGAGVTVFYWRPAVLALRAGRFTS